MGLVSPLGASASAFFDALSEGRSALRRDAGLGAHLPEGADPAPWVARIGEFGAAAIDAARRRRMPRIGQLCVVAAHQALGGAETGTIAPGSPVCARYGKERVGVSIGTGLGALEMSLEFSSGYLRDGLAAASPAAFPYTVMNAPAGLLAIEHQLLGPNLTVNHRDLSLTEALASAADLLLCGRADAVVAGGCEELSTWLLHAYARLGVLPPLDPDAADADGPPMRPYDRGSRGLCPGEGAAMFLLERAEDAARRGAPVLAYLRGIGRAGDDRPRLGWIAPGAPPSIDGAVRAVQDCLAAARIDASEIGFVSGAGNGTVLDAVETLALRGALGSAAERVPIASIIGQTGELMSSAGFRVAAALYALGRQALPGTAGCLHPDPARALPGLIQHPQPSPGPIRHVLIPTFAMGGGNAALILSAEP